MSSKEPRPLIEVMRFFLLDRLWTVATFVIFILSQCRLTEGIEKGGVFENLMRRGYLNQPALINDPTPFACTSQRHVGTACLIVKMTNSGTGG